jgi:8-oxo-dGTP pyrophosphatase MutT (NUDIX family)
MNKYNFQNCQKIVVFSHNGTKVLLAKRKGEADYNSTFSFIGGKMETSDSSIINGLKREKDEEAGKNFKIKIYPTFSINLLFRKKDGSVMILPHYYAVHVNGNVKLCKEYSEYRWVNLNELDSFEPKIPTIPDIVKKFIRFKKIMNKDEFVLI